MVDAFRLKDEVRSGWVMRGVRGPESVADHSWGTAYLALVYCDAAGVDRARALEIATVHDLAEAVTGDVATRVAGLDEPEGVAAKRAREMAAIDRLLSEFPVSVAERLRRAWEEYEARETPVARFVRDMNLLDMCIQATIYETDRRYDDKAPNPHFPDFAGLDEFFATTAARLSTELGRRLFSLIVDRYAAIERVSRRGGPRLEADPAGGTRPDSHGADRSGGAGAPGDGRERP